MVLVTVLFTDGMEINLDDFRSVWRLSGRVLIVGLPLTLLIMALLTHCMTGRQVYRTAVPEAALVILLSIILHSSTDVLATRLFQKTESQERQSDVE